ncbi:UNVERIFIED_CONTAM: MLO-like protein 9 [Sesamum latifolium]|uniref:MLO-like protein n=1 Tax=Sesamum latifolium TaxID=2727402 RepID=A0AAW2VXU1_9LAMI
MGGGGGGLGASRQLDQTPTWAVALVCAIIVLISVILEKSIHKVGESFSRRKKFSLLEALDKIKAELMILGFISLLLTFGQNFISKICVPEHIGNTMLPCSRDPHANEDHHHRRLLWHERRFLGADSPGEGCKKGYVPLISVSGLHQLHIFIFFLAIFHVINSGATMRLGRMKIRAWKEWEEAIAAEEESANDPTRFRLTHETSFVKGHTSPWVTNAALFYIASFFRHMMCAVSKADYFALRHGFISVHLAPGKKFDFQKYIKRSLEDDFKVIVGIPPALWSIAVIYLLVNVNGASCSSPPVTLLLFGIEYLPFDYSFLQLIDLLRFRMASYVLAIDNAPSVGTKLQSIITRMAIEIQERHAVVQGIPLVQVTDRHFWFNRPKLLLNLLHITLFQNAFEITYFIWTTYEFGLYSCFHDYFTLTLIRVCIGVFVQFFCSYITLPLYALVSQMGSHMKKSIFDEQTSRALMNWHRKVKKRSESSCKPHSYRLGSSISLTNIISSKHGDSSVAPASKRETGDGSTKVDILPESTAPAAADDNQPGKTDLLPVP